MAYQDNDIAELINVTATVAAEVAIVRLLVETLFVSELVRACPDKASAIGNLNKLWKSLSDAVDRPDGRYRSLSNHGADAFSAELDRIFGNIRKQIDGSY